MSWRYVLLIIFSMNSSYVPYLCNANILVKFGTPVDTHYSVVSEKRDPPVSSDSEDDEVPSHDLQLLCDVVLNAKQFTPIQNRTRFQRYEESWNSILRARAQFDLNAVDTAGVSYQRRYFLRSASALDCSTPKQLSCRIHLSTASEEIDCWLCVKATKPHDFSAHQKSAIYMLERDTNEDGNGSDFRFTGIYETTAIVDRDSPISEEYFLAQFRTSRYQMESVCELALDDRLRLCSAVFDAFTSEMSLKEGIAQMNYVVERRCRSRNILPEITRSPTRLLKCSLADDARKIYVLGDARERGAAFVFLQYGEGRLEPQGRVTEVGALLDPICSKERGKIAEDREMEGECDKRSSTSTSKGKNLEHELDEKVTDVEEAEQESVAEKRAKRKPEFGDETRVKKWFEFEEPSDSESERKVKMLANLEEQPGEEMLPMSGGAERRKRGRPSAKSLGKTSKRDFEAKARNIWKTYNPKYRSRDVSRKEVPEKPTPTSSSSEE